MHPHRTPSRRHASRRARTGGLLAVGALMGTACTGSDSADPDTSQAPASDTVPGTVDETPPVDSDDVEEATTTTSSTTTTSTTTTTTTIPAPDPVPIVRAGLPTVARTGQQDNVSSAVALDGDEPVGLLAGSSAPEVGTGSQATVYSFTPGGVWSDPVKLDQGDGVESEAYGIFGTGDAVAVAGVVVNADGSSTGALWRSTDRGVTFGDAEFAIDESSSSVDVAFVEDTILVVSRRPVREENQSHQLITSIEGPNGWDSVVLPTSGTDPTVGGITVEGSRVVITGSVDQGDRNRGAVWVSDDGGRTFEEIVDEAISARSDIGVPVPGGDGIIATGSSPGNEPMVLLTSADARTWRPIGLDITNQFDESITVSATGATQVLPIEGGYIVGITDLVGAAATVDSNGRGTSMFAAPIDDDVMGPPAPFLVAGQVFAYSNSRSTMRVAELNSSGSWERILNPPGASSGPVATSVELFETAQGPWALSTSFPHVTGTYSNGFSYGPDERWTEPADGEWNRFDPGFGRDVGAVSANAATEIAVSFTEDLADDEIPGPNLGTSIGFRDIGDEDWSAPELVLTGPGGDYLLDVEGTFDGFLAVGTRFKRDANGVDTTGPVVMIYANGAWNEEPVVADVGDLASLGEVEITPGGVTIATGSYQVDGVSEALVLTRDANGAWVQSVLPGEAVDVSIYDVVASEDAISLLTREDGRWFLHRTSDGVAFESEELVFDSTQSFPQILVDVDGRTVLVGVDLAGGASSLGVWAIDPTGMPVSVELAESVSSLSLEIDGAIVDGDSLLVAGTIQDENSVWTLGLPELVEQIDR